MKEWSIKELSAAIEAYLQMLSLEQKGESYNKAAVQRMLLSGPIKERTSTERRMQNISYVMETMGHPYIEGYKPLSNVGPKFAEVIQNIISEYMNDQAAPIPLYPPIAVKAGRKLPPTGYWMFVCNRKTWDGEAWLRSAKNQLLYKVSDHNHTEVQPGDFGVLRINKKSIPKGHPAQSAAVYAIVQIAGTPQRQIDPDSEHYSDTLDAAESVWRVPLNILANLADRPISVEDLPTSDDFTLFRKPLQTSSIAISRLAFAEIYRRSDLIIPRKTMANTSQGVRVLEGEAFNAAPERRKRISSYIERGNIGKKIKTARNGRCQICEALGQEPIAFKQKDGSPYSEAHHVQPVSLLLAGSLGSNNIMVLCPNHHRQAHYGAFEVLENSPSSWRVRLDHDEMEILKTVLIS